MSAAETTVEDPGDIIGRTIIVKGDVNGGYIRTCIKNEAGNFRRLIGTMSPPDTGSDTATIYVEGKRKMVDGFVRWCERGSKKVGLSQSLDVVETSDEVPTGLYDGFYLRTLEE
jgi:acylphosphatase